MTAAALWNILHILAMFVAFGFTTGVGIYLTALAASGDVRLIRAATRGARPLQTAGAVVLLVGVIFGFATAAAIGFSLTAKWLLIAYVLLILLLVIGVGVHRMWAERLAKAAAASPDDHASPELQAVIDDRFVRLAGPLSGLLWIGLVAMMVLRPA
jgi:uncharacterized membrane protein